MIKLFAKVLKKVGYVDSVDLKDYLAEIKRKERERTTEELKSEFSEEKQKIKQDHFFEIEEKNAEIKHLETRIDDMKQYVKDAEKVYVFAMRGAKTNLRVSAEIGYQVKKLMESSATVYGAFEKIQEQAKDHENEMLDHEKDNRSLLKLDS